MLLTTTMLATLALAGPEGKLDPALAKEVGAAMDKAVGFYRLNQDPSGSFGPAKFGPGITALAVTGLLRTKRVTVADPLIAKALAFLEKNIQPDGGVYVAGGGQRVYMTSVALLAFVEANKDGRYKKVVADAVAFLKKEQWSGERAPPEDYKHGGWGYDSKGRPDLSNTSLTLEALEAAGVPKDDPAFKEAVTFLRRTQNYAGEGGNDKLEGKAAADLDGGHFYTPVESKAGKTAAGGMRAYGSMTYAGLKSFIYAGLTKDDPRVQAALGWVQKFYSVDENPGMGQKGVYYYYHTFAKAVKVVGLDTLTDAAGKKRHWRNDLAKAIVARQKPDGSWSNKDGTWLENESRLSTAFALLALANLID